MSRRATVHQHIYGVIAAACPRPRGGTDRESRPVFCTGDAPKDFGLSIGVLDHSGIKGVAKYKYVPFHRSFASIVIVSPCLVKSDMMSYKGILML